MITIFKRLNLIQDKEGKGEKLNRYSIFQFEKIIKGDLWWSNGVIYKMY